MFNHYEPVIFVYTCTALRNVAGCLTERIKSDSEAFWKIQLPEKIDQSFSAFSILHIIIRFISSFLAHVPVGGFHGHRIQLLVTFLSSKFCCTRVHRLGLLNTAAVIGYQGWLRKCIQNDIIDVCNS